MHVRNAPRRPRGGSAPASATAITLTGPSSGTVSVASSNFTVGANGAVGTSIVVTPSSGGGGGTFTPTTVTLTTGSPTGTFTYTPASTGAKTISVTNNQGLTNPSSITYTSNAVADLFSAVAFDAATPHQISINTPQTRTPAAGTTVRVDYRVNGASTWIDGGYLYQIDATNVAHGGGAVLGFAGWVLGCVPGTTYDVKLEVVESGNTTSIQTTHATRALPAEGAAMTGAIITTAATFLTRLASASPGDVLVLQDGTYTFTGGLNLNVGGSSGSPLVIRGQTRAGVVIASTTADVVSLNASHVVLENLTLRGSQIADTGSGAGTSRGISTSGTRRANFTVRHCKFDGFDTAFKAYDFIDGLLFYDNEVAGNKTHAVLVGDETNGTAHGYNGDGVGMPGLGNSVWNCTFSGHGDVIKLTDQAHAAGGTRAAYVHHNWVKWSGDDFFEADDTAGNTCAYNNIVCNTTTATSCADNYGGPHGIVRNVFINQSRHPLKLNGNSFGSRVQNNTFLFTNKRASQNFGFYNASSTNYGFDYRNNALIYRGSGLLVQWNASLPSAVRNYNAWYPDGGGSGGFQFGNDGGGASTLAQAKANYAAPNFDNDLISPSSPFATAITLASDYTTRYDGHTDVTLAGGSALRNAGVAIPGVTDGFTGAAPDMGAIITGQSFGSVGCTWAANVPSWVASQASQTWAVVPMTNKLADLDPGQNASINPNHPGVAPWDPNGQRQAQIVDAWCGAAYDEQNDRYWLGIGGGHSNYWGNEVYRSNLSSEAPAWTLVRKPSGSLGFSAVTLGVSGTYVTGRGYHEDGRPAAVHGYNGWVHVPGVGAVFTAVSGVTQTNVGTDVRKWVFIDEVTGESSYTSECTLYGLSQGGQPAVCYDSKRHAIWFFGDNTSTAVKYTIPTSGGAHTGTFANVGSAYSVYGYVSAVYLPDDDCILLASADYSRTVHTFIVIDCTDGSRTTATVSGSYSCQANAQADTQLRWVTSLNAVCLWNNASSTTLITKMIKPANPRSGTWVVSALPVAGGSVTPSAKTTEGTYGRFAYSPRMGGFFLFNSTGGPGSTITPGSGPVYFYKI